MTRRPLKLILPWTDEDNAALSELIDRGLAVGSIARKMKRSEKTIAKRMHLLNIGRREPPVQM